MESRPGQDIRPKRGLTAAGIQNTALASHVLMALVIIVTNLVDGIHPKVVVVVTGLALSVSLVMILLVAVRRLQRWQDYAAGMLILFSSRTLLHTADRHVTAVRDAGVHFVTVAATIIKTGHIPDSQARGRVAGYEAYPAHHLELAASTLLSGWDSVFESAAMLGALFTLTTAGLVMIITRTYKPHLTLASLVAFAIWTPVVDFGALYKPITYGTVMIAIMFVLLPQIHYPRQLVLFFVALAVLTITHHYTSTMGAIALTLAILLPLIIEDFQGRRSKTWSARIAGASGATASLALLVALVPIAYWTVGSYDLGRFVAIRNPFSFEVIVDPGTQPLDPPKTVPSEAPISPFFLLLHSFTLWPVALAAVMGAYYIYKAKFRWNALSAGAVAFGLLQAVGLVYPTFFPHRQRGLASILGAAFVAMAVEIKMVRKQVGLILPVVFVASLIAFTSAFSVNYLYPWSQGDVRTRFLWETEPAVVGELNYVLPDNPLPFHRSVVDARMFTSELIGLPTRAVRPVAWLWPPIEPDFPEQLHYWFLEESAQEYGSRANIPAGAPLDIRGRFVNYPKQIHIDTLDTTRVILDQGDHTLWHPTFF